MRLNLGIDTGTSATPVTSGSTYRTFENLSQMFHGIAGGVGYFGYSTGSLFTWENVKQAYAVAIFAGATGSVTVQINTTTHNVVVTGSAASTDTVKANAMVAVINASTGSDVAGYVHALPFSSSVYLVANEYGNLGNLNSLVVAGTGLTRSSALFQSGSSGVSNNYRF